MESDWSLRNVVVTGSAQGCILQAESRETEAARVWQISVA